MNPRPLAPYLSAKLSLPILGLLAIFIAQCAAPVGPQQVNLNNTRPVALAGPDIDGEAGIALTLDGTASYDPDGDEIGFYWLLADAPEDSALGDAPFSANEDRNAEKTTLIPDVAGIYQVALRVRDSSDVDSDVDFVILTIAEGGLPPIADAGPNAAGLEGSEICLDGSGSTDPGGATLSYSWDLVATPSGSSLSAADIAASGSAACINADAPGSYTVSLVVDNGDLESEPDFAFVTVASTNQGPTAIAEIVDAFSCSTVLLSGAGSTDPENDPLHYSWDILLVPDASAVPLGPDAFDDPSSATPSFYADVEGGYMLQLVVNDGEDYSQPVFVELSLGEKPTNQPPQVLHSEDAYISAPSPTCNADSYGNCTSCPNCPSANVALDASDSFDPDGDPLTISWTILSGNATLDVDFGLSNEINVAGAAGSCNGSVNRNEVQVQVTATDCSGATGSSVITFVSDCGI